MTRDRQEDGPLAGRHAPRVLVLVPTYERPASLRTTLLSVLEQDVDGLQVIVADNASGPETAAVVAELDDPRLVHDRLDVNVGMNANLTRCLTLGEAPLRYLLHDDDVMLPGNLARKVAFLEAHPTAGMVHSAFRNVDDDGRPVGPVLNWPGVTRDTLQPGREFVRQSIAVGGTVCVASVLLRSAAVVGESFDPDDGPYGDNALWLRIATHWDVGFLPEPLVGYRVHAGSASSTHATLRVRRGRTVTTQRHATVTRLAHGRYVDRAELDPAERALLTALLRRCDRRLRVRIAAQAVLPPRALAALKSAVGWRPGSRLHRALAVETGPAAPPSDDRSSDG